MSILLFLAIFIPTLLLQRWLHQHIQGLALALTGNAGCAVRLLFYLLLPGILLHEASHYIAARLLFVKTNGVKIGVSQTRSKQISLGSVNINHTDPVRESLIGIAPFVVGIGAIWLIAGIGFDLWPGRGLNLGKFIASTMEYARDWTTWLGVYLIFAVSTAMIPSESDREPWGPVLTFIGALVAILFLLGWTPTVPPNVIETARQFIDALNFALGVALAVNACVAGLLLLFEQTWRKMGGRPVEYRVKRK